MILLVAGLYALNHLAHVSGPINNSHIHSKALDIQAGFANALIAPYRLQVQERSRSFFTGDELIGGTQSRFHNAAGIAKNYAGATALAHEIIISGVLQPSEVNALFLSPLGQLSGRNDSVHVSQALNAQIARCVAHFFATNFKLLGCAGSQGYIDDFLGVQAHFLSEVGLNSRTLHTNGALSAGNIGQYFRIVHFCELNPSGAAASELGQGSTPLSNALNQLATFLHNGQIGSEIGVQNIVHAQLAQQGYHFAFHKGACAHAKLFAQSHAHGRGSADDDDLIRVGHSLANILIFITLGETVYRAYLSALTTMNADALATCFF